MAKKICVTENMGNLENLPKHEIWFAQVVNSLILKVKVSFVYVIVKWHRENLRSDRENTGNSKMQFEWVP